MTHGGIRINQAKFLDGKSVESKDYSDRMPLSKDTEKNIGGISIR
jgi:hypothetical protein